MRDVITGRLRSRVSQKIISANLFKKFLPLTASVNRTPKYGIRIKVVNGALNIFEEESV